MLSSLLLIDDHRGCAMLVMSHVETCAFQENASKLKVVYVILHIEMTRILRKCK